MDYRRHLTIITLLLLGTVRAFAADITGTWKASFDTQIGTRMNLRIRRQGHHPRTGKLQSDMGGAANIQQGKVEGDKVSFVEMFKFDGNEIQITYTGQVNVQRRNQVHTAGR